KQSEELAARNEQLQKAARLKDDFLAITSHELRTPLNGIIGTTSLLIDTSLSEEQRDQVRVIESSSLSLLRLVNDMLDLSKIQGTHALSSVVGIDEHSAAGKLPAERAPFEPVACIDSAVEMVAPLREGPRTSSGDRARAPADRPRRSCPASVSIY